MDHSRLVQDGSRFRTEKIKSQFSLSCLPVLPVELTQTPKKLLPALTGTLALIAGDAQETTEVTFPFVVDLAGALVSVVSLIRSK